MRKRVRTATAVSLCLTLCVYATHLATLSASADGTPGPVGGVSVLGRVLINGSEVISGAAVFTGSRFATEKDSVAEITLGGLGRLKCMSESAGTVSFGDGAVAGSLEAGIVHVSKPRGVAATVSTKDGSAVAGEDGEAVFVVNVTGGNTVVRAMKGSVELRSGKTTKVIAEGQDGSAGTPQTTPRDDDDDDDDYGGWFWFGAVGYTAIVTTAIVIVLTDDDEGANAPGDPTVVNPSPFR